MSSSDGALQSFQWDKFHGSFVWSVIYSSLHNYMYNYCTESFSNVCLCGKKVIQRRSFSYFNFSNINKFKTHCVRNTMQTAKRRVQLSGPIYMSLMKTTGSRQTTCGLMVLPFMSTYLSTVYRNKPLGNAWTTCFAKRDASSRLLSTVSLTMHWRKEACWVLLPHCLYALNNRDDKSVRSQFRLISFLKNKKKKNLSLLTVQTVPVALKMLTRTFSEICLSTFRLLI